jgi:hypothetical protein
LSAGFLVNLKDGPPQWDGYALQRVVKALCDLEKPLFTSNHFPPNIEAQIFLKGNELAQNLRYASTHISGVDMHYFRSSEWPCKLTESIYHVFSGHCHIILNRRHRDTLRK